MEGRSEGWKEGWKEGPSSSTFRSDLSHLTDVGRFLAAYQPLTCTLVWLPNTTVVGYFSLRMPGAEK